MITGSITYNNPGGGRYDWTYKDGVIGVIDDIGHPTAELVGFSNLNSDQIDLVVTGWALGRLNGIKAGEKVGRESAKREIRFALGINERP